MSESFSLSPSPSPTTAPTNYKHMRFNNIQTFFTHPLTQQLPSLFLFSLDQFTHPSRSFLPSSEQIVVVAINDSNVTKANVLVLESCIHIYIYTHVYVGKEEGELRSTVVHYVVRTCMRVCDIKRVKERTVVESERKRERERERDGAGE